MVIVLFFLESKLKFSDLLCSGVNRIKINLIFMLSDFSWLNFQCQSELSNVWCVTVVLKWCGACLSSVLYSPGVEVKVGKLGWFEVPSALLLRISYSRRAVIDGDVLACEPCVSLLKGQEPLG